MIIGTATYLFTEQQQSYSNCYAVELISSFLSQVLIKQIESSDNVHIIGSAISNLLSLTQDGPQLCSIIAKVQPTQ